MNDTGEIAKHAKICLFADDTNVFIVSDGPIFSKKNTQNTLFDLSEWFAANKLSLNKDKSCYSIFASPVKLSTVPWYLNTIWLGNIIIKRVHHAKCVGLILDESWALKNILKIYFIWGNEVHSHVTCNSAKLHIRQPLNERKKKCYNIKAHISGTNYQKQSGSPCCNFSYYNYISTWPYYISGLCGCWQSEGATQSQHYTL